jgi:hypothetical protein
VLKVPYPIPPVIGRLVLGLVPRIPDVHLDPTSPTAMPSRVLRVKLLG